MTPAQVARPPAQTLDDAKHYSSFEQVYLLWDSFLPCDVLSRLQMAYEDLIERYRPPISVRGWC